MTTEKEVSTSKVTAGDIISSTVNYSNRLYEGRTFDINANVRISGGKVSGIENGNLSPRGETDKMANGSFSCANGLTHFSFHSNGLEDEASIRQAVNEVIEFISDVTAKISEEA